MTHEHRAEHIVVGIDGSIASHAAIRWAVDHAQPGDTITLVHAWEPSPSLTAADLGGPDDESAHRFATRELARALGCGPVEGVTIRINVIRGDAREQLCAQDADVLVIGAGGHSRLGGALLGSVSAHMAHHCRRPLVIVPCPDRPTRSSA